MCAVNKRTRYQCQYCRFEKCLSVWMNPERIQNKNAMTKKISNKSYKKTVRTISCVDNYTIVIGRYSLLSKIKNNIRYDKKL